MRAQPHLEVMTITDVTMWLKKEGFAEDVLSAFEGESVKSSQFNGVCAECAFSGTYIIDAPATCWQSASQFIITISTTTRHAVPFYL